MSRYERCNRQQTKSMVYIRLPIAYTLLPIPYPHPSSLKSVCIKSFCIYQVSTYLSSLYVSIKSLRIYQVSTYLSSLYVSSVGSYTVSAAIAFSPSGAGFASESWMIYSNCFSSSCSSAVRHLPLRPLTTRSTWGDGGFGFRVSGFGFRV
jgi:hypothetical protein